jgi:hypothetical protein
MENLTTKIKTYVALALLVASIASGAGALNVAGPAQATPDDAIVATNPARALAEEA